MKLFARLGSRKLQFESGQLEETSEPVSNPLRGWYRIFSFDIDIPVQSAYQDSVLQESEQLVFVQVNIAVCKERDISESELYNFREILEYFKSRGKDILLRIVYDREGKGLEHEPISVKRICAHMNALGPIAAEYESVIYLVQGLFLGSWGEMHDSKFLSGEHLRLLKETWFAATGHKLRLAVRRPVYVRMLLQNMPRTKEGLPLKPVDGNLIEWIGLYNDAMLSDANDMGTYALIGKQMTDWEQPWERESELAFQQELCQFVPNGGEVIGESTYSDCTEAVRIMRRMHISYLNSQYQSSTLTKWKQSIWQEDGIYKGMSGWDYISAHLGYRFVLRSGRLESKDGTIHLNIENTGFANSYEDLVFILKMKTVGVSNGEDCMVEKDKTTRMYDKINALQEVKILTRQQIAAPRLASGRQTEVVIQVNLPPANQLTEDAALYLSIQQACDGREIRFANRYQKEGIYLGLFTNG